MATALKAPSPTGKPNSARLLSPAGTPSTMGSESDFDNQRSTRVPLKAEDGQRVRTSTHSRKRSDRPELVAGVYKVEKKLGEGSFGMVYSAVHCETREKVAVKMECVRSPDAGQLQNEADILRKLAEGEGRPLGFPDLLAFCVEGQWSCLTMNMLHLSLEDAMDLCSKMNVRSVVLIADRMIILLAYLHSKGIVHRDIKCENFLFGAGPKSHHLHMIDYGMSTPFWTGKRHVSLHRGQDLTGTARYASINAMRGYTQSRRDDLEATAHVLIYLLRGSLPWSGLKAKDYKERLQRIVYTKRTVPIEDLCKELPNEFAILLHKSRTMKFEKRPNYDGFRSMFRKLRESFDPPVEDHDLMWLTGPTAKLQVDLSTLVPLDNVTECAPQPEETMAPPEQQAASELPQDATAPPEKTIPSRLLHSRASATE